MIHDRHFLNQLLASIDNPLEAARAGENPEDKGLTSLLTRGH